MRLPDFYEYAPAMIVGEQDKASRAKAERRIEEIRHKHQRSMQYNLRRVMRSEQSMILEADDNFLEYARVLELHTPWMTEIYETIYKSTADEMYPLVQEGALLKSYNRRERKDLTQEELYRQYIDDWLKVHGGAKITQINQTTMQEIRAVLVDADTAEQVRAALNRYFNQNIADRALRIAWTETSTATNVGSLQCVRAVASRESSKIWRTLQDAQVRDSHAMMESQPVDTLKDRFRVPSKFGWDMMECPGDPAGSAANVVNCRCWTQYQYHD